MPNQIAQSKERRSLTEHNAVMALLADIAQQEETSEMALIRRALREFIRAYAENPAQRKRLRSIAMAHAPEPPEYFETPTQLARFKRRQREFDQLLLELNLDTPESLEARNSVLAPSYEIHVAELEGKYNERDMLNLLERLLNIVADPKGKSVLETIGIRPHSIFYKLNIDAGALPRIDGFFTKRLPRILPGS